MTPPKRARKPLTPTQRQEADELRAKIKVLTAVKCYASATACRRKLRALLGGWELI